MDRWGLLGWIISLKTATNTKSPLVLKTSVFYDFSRSILQTNSNYCRVMSMIDALIPNGKTSDSEKFTVTISEIALNTACLPNPALFTFQF